MNAIDNRSHTSTRASMGTDSVQSLPKEPCPGGRFWPVLAARGELDIVSQLRIGRFWPLAPMDRTRPGTPVFHLCSTGAPIRFRSCSKGVPKLLRNRPVLSYKTEHNGTKRNTKSEKREFPYLNRSFFPLIWRRPGDLEGRLLRVRRSGTDWRRELLLIPVEALGQQTLSRCGISPLRSCSFLR